MSEDSELHEEQLPLEGAGQSLRRAREGLGKSLEDIAGQTRIPIRHLNVIEEGNFSELPARTYAIGFSRTYARAVGLDEKEIAEQVRYELGEDTSSSRNVREEFAPGDPARLPSRGLAWFSAFAAILLLVGGFAFFRGYFIPGSGPAPLQEDAPAEQVAETGDTPGPELAVPVGGEVVFTSLQDGVWVKFYDADGERLMEKQMAKGEAYTVPAAANGPQVWTGQPEALRITVGGQAIGTLSNESEILRDIPVTAQALLARANAPANGADDPSATTAASTN